MRSPIEDEVHISPIHDGTMVNSVFLVCMRIEDCNLKIPHAGHCIKNHFITPELLVQQHPAVAFVSERTFEGGCGLLKSIVGLQSHMLIEPHPLSILYQPHNHLVAKVSGWVVGVVQVASSTYT